MTRPIAWSRLIGLVIALAAGGPAAAGAADFDSFVGRIGGYCMSAASRACYARAFEFADRNRDGHLDLAEARAFHAALQSWAIANRDRLAPADRQALFTGLLIVQIVGLPALFASYDTDQDGRLTPAELAADVRLDGRPLPVLARDPDAVDWPRLRSRLGVAGALLGGIVPGLS
jgi:Ca2+-binding EF-hand superfamily protein